MTRLLLVCAAGGLGSGARYLLGVGVVRLGLGPLPWGTLAVNVLGCFLIELVLGAARGRIISDAAALTLATGFLGGFTTYSAFNSQVLSLYRTAPTTAALYLLATVLGCLAAGLAGLALAGVLWRGR